MLDNVHILIVEDSLTQAAEIKYFLAKSGYNVSVCYEGEEAWTFMQKQEAPPSIVISDIVMPKMDGYELCEKIKQHEKFSDVMVMLLTALSEPTDIIKGLKCQADSFLVKPYNESFLLGRVRHLLEYRNSTKEMSTDMGLAIDFFGQRHFLTNTRVQVINNLLSVHDTVETQSNELKRALEAEKKLKESEERYKALFERSLECVFIHDFDGNFIDANKASLNLIGYDRDDIPSLNFASLLSEDQFPLTIQMLKELEKAGHQKGTVEFRLKHKNGGYVDVEAQSSVIYRDGKPYAIQGIARDITERKKHEEALRESEEKYRTFFNTSRDSVYISSMDGRLLDINDAAVELFGYGSREELQKAKILDFYEKPKDREDFINILGKQGFAREHPVNLRKKDGRIINTLITAVPKMDEDGNIIAFQGTIRDITDQIKAEEEMKILSKAVEQSPASIIITDSDGTIEYVNKTFTKITGYTFAEVKGLNPRILQSGETSKEVFKDLWDTITSGKVWEGEIKNKTKAGDFFWEKAVIGPILNADGNISHYLAQKENITEKRALEEQLRQAQKMEAIGTLAGGIAHDFNNILAAILGFSELALFKVEKGSQTEDHLQKIYTAGNRAKSLVKQILALSRQDGMESKPIQISPLVKETVKMLRATIPASIEIQENFCSERLVVHADPTQIHQVIINLATNATHVMTGASDVLEVCVEPVSFDESIDAKYIDVVPGNYARITVSDTGHGIPEEHLDKIFEPYFTTKAEGVGTGLGLSVVHGIVKLHKGHITVHSELGKGTTFHVYLPLTEECSDETLAYTAEQIPTGTERILLVDDEPPIVEMQQESLELLGYTVTARVSSMEALEAFRSSPDNFDLVITDMAMPNMTGDKLAYEIKKIRSDVPIILCTGFSENINIRSGSDFQINGFLMKPVDRAKMAKTIRRVLDNK